MRSTSENRCTTCTSRTMSCAERSVDKRERTHTQLITQSPRSTQVCTQYLRGGGQQLRPLTWTQPALAALVHPSMLVRWHARTCMRMSVLTRRRARHIPSSTMCMLCTGSPTSISSELFVLLFLCRFCSFKSQEKVITCYCLVKTQKITFFCCFQNSRKRSRRNAERWLDKTRDTPFFLTFETTKNRKNNDHPTIWLNNPLPNFC